MDLNGRVRSIVGKDGFCNIRFQGQVYDDDIQLCYNRFRWYDDVDGRYISKDPIGLESREANFYSYVGDSNGWVDVFGLDTIKLRHYTSNKGLAGMKEDMVIKAYDQNTVFAEKAKGKPLSAADVSKKYGISKSSARNYVEFDVDADRVSVKKNPYTKAVEYKVKGDVQLDKKTTKFVKRCQ
ncbi:RHS repeat-associated core domain-containing protein [Tenacibaculum maritimum]|uniref:RHS repeat-associated core domain-containing protein n=1 Tax=Tenacibaculum maritimum TaxID=107401 RepID=UPI0012E4C8AC|nr:RHS repeat-associated core domain-containing protein [Tenacibaculum maritimum]CAA0149419.1 RHS family protein [Tenacibaculum maritimum]